MDNLVHNFVQNLGFKIKPVYHKKTRKVDAKTASRILLSNAERECSSTKVSIVKKNTKCLFKNDIGKEQNKDFRRTRASNSSIDKCSLTANVTRYIRKETELNDKYLELQSKDVDFVKKNLQISLYIAAKNIGMNDLKMTIPKHRQMILLCEQAVLSLIEPSDKVTVLYNDDFPTLVQYHLTHGYRYHFNFQFNAEDDYRALLVLSYWAGSLVKHPNITLIRTISCILTCSPCKILVLSYPKENLNI